MVYQFYHCTIAEDIIHFRHMTSDTDTSQELEMIWKSLSCDLTFMFPKIVYNLPCEGCNSIFLVSCNTYEPQLITNVQNIHQSVRCGLYILVATNSCVTTSTYVPLNKRKIIPGTRNLSGFPEWSVRTQSLEKDLLLPFCHASIVLTAF